MEKLNTIVCDNSYDNDLLKIKNFNLHKELLPFIGYNYKRSRLLLVGESHYVKRNNLSEEDIINTYADWYDESTESIERAMVYREWFTTRNVIRNFQCRYRSRAYTMFSNPAKMIKELLGDKCPTDTAAFSYVAFCNYYQRPSLMEGRSINPVFPKEEALTAEIFEELIEILKPKGIIFLSKKSYDSFMNNKKKEYSLLLDFTHHPTSLWWYRSKGREKFTRMIGEFFSKDTLTESLVDERIWLMKNLFKEIEENILTRGYDFKSCPEEFIYDFYRNPRETSKRPYLEILKGSKKIEIEIDSRIYIWKTKKDWEYLPIGGKRTKKDSEFDTPNFRRFNKAYRDLFDEENRKKFIDTSIDFISRIVG